MEASNYSLFCQDVNDHTPIFEHPSYNCLLGEEAKRGQFINRITATDPDITDQARLKYAIVGGNELQAFAVDRNTGKLHVNRVQCSMHGLTKTHTQDKRMAESS